MNDRTPVPRRSPGPMASVVGGLAPRERVEVAAAVYGALAVAEGVLTGYAALWPAWAYLFASLAMGFLLWPYGDRDDGFPRALFLWFVVCPLARTFVVLVRSAVSGV